MNDSIKAPQVYVGMKLFKEVFNRSLKESEIKECVVSKIGTKYFYLVGSDKPIDKITLKHHDKVYYQASFQLYLTREEILERNERSKLIEAIRKYFHLDGRKNESTLPQLRTIAGILDIKLDNG